MGALLTSKYFNAEGHILGGLQTTLPDSLDWKCINEKEVFVRYMGGMPPGTAYALIESQGESKLLSDLNDDALVPLDHDTYRRKINGAEAHLEERCRELGIDRSVKPRNQ